MVRDVRADVHQFLERTIDIHIIIRITETFLKGLEDLGLADTGFAQQDTGGRITDDFDDGCGFSEGSLGGELNGSIHNVSLTNM